MTSRTEMSVFLAALDHEAEPARRAYLADACAGDPRLRAAVDALLAAHARPDNPLDDAPPAVAGAVRDVAAEATGHAEAGGHAFPPDPPDRPADDALGDGPGSVIGPYRLMEQIGEGGFGLVFVAAQQRPVRRQVALKVIKPGMDTREVIARFEAERQALAMMNHPNIARVFDGGVTHAGRPYFVMELVRGVPVTEFCDTNDLPMPARLRLFVDVCQAVQHAHTKGVIHRDLKPTNVLVTLGDGEPVVKVIDFGVAKAVGQELTDKTLYTRFAQMIGTPLYMSPEQAEMTAVDVDTRSDIYSLGVLLYELLTGTTPFDRDRMKTAGVDEVRRIIRDEEPPRPSARLNTLGGGLAAAAARRRIDPRRLASTVRGDLDWVVMKALEKQRSRRYETAAALAQDVRRFLAGDPVEARPPSTAYRFGKFARRNKLALTTAGLVTAALVLGTAVSIWQAVRASEARAEADRLRRQAEDFSDRLKEANVLIAAARDDLDQGRWGVAHTNYSRAVKLQPNHYLAWAGRGSLYVRIGLWELAAADYATALELGASAYSPGWLGVPQLMLYANDESHYRQVCAQLLQQADRSFEGTVVRSAALARLPAADPAVLVARAEKVLADPQGLDDPQDPGDPRGQGEPRGPGEPRAPGDLQGSDAPRPDPEDRRGPSPADYYAAGLAHYRAGDYPRAADRLRESLAGDGRWAARPMAYPALAMAYYRLGKPDDARRALAAARAAVARWTDQLAQGTVGTMPILWVDWLECLLLYREAEELLTGAAPPPDPRLQVVEARALSAVRR